MPQHSKARAARRPPGQSLLSGPGLAARAVGGHQTFVPIGIDSLDAEDELIDRCVFQGELSHISGEYLSFPIRGRCRAHHNDKARQIRIRIGVLPGQRRIVAGAALQTGSSSLTAALSAALSCCASLSLLSLLAGAAAT